MLAFGGRTADGRPFVIGDLVAGGSGASAERDGVDVIETDATNCMNLPVEAIEMEAPIRVQPRGAAPRFRRRRHASRRPGQRPGIRDAGGAISFTHRGERHFCPARGCDGGGDGARRAR